MPKTHPEASVESRRAIVVHAHVAPQRRYNLVQLATSCIGILPALPCRGPHGPRLATKARRPNVLAGGVLHLAEVPRQLALLLFDTQLHTGLISAFLEKGQALLPSHRRAESSEVGGRTTMVPLPDHTVRLCAACMNRQNHQKLGSACENCGKLKPVAPPNLH